MIGRTNAGGGGLKLYVVGGTTQPSNPAENTVWINTANTITDWLIQDDEPDSPTEGLVWISTSANANTKVNVLWMHGLTFGFGTPMQYLSGAWVTKTAKIYMNGAWVDSQTFVYKDGSYNENYATDTSLSSSFLVLTLVGSDPYIDIKASNSGVSVNAYAYAYFNNKIDLTEVKKIKFTYSADGMGNTSDIRRGFRFAATTGTGSNQWSADTKTDAIYSNPSVASPASVELDVTALTGENYVGFAFNCWGGDCWLHVHAVELIL